MIQRVLLLLALALMSSGVFIGCSAIIITRTVEDTYTRTLDDTTITTTARNEPGARENGVIYPAPRVVEIQRSLTQNDSIVKRDYPNFIRLGLFESAGLIGTASSGKGIGTGLFGVFYDPADLLASTISGKSSTVFGGGLYRFGIMEYRLRWFRDAPNWTIGTNAVEVMYPESTNEKSLMSFFPLYLRKRYYLREQIPYICVTPTFGVGWYPSQYVNIGGTLDAGSMGGLNFRAYVGVMAGVNAPGNFFNDSKSAVTVTAPYFGLGVSVIDFLNRVPELGVEWKDHEHSAWNIGIAHMMLMRTTQDSSFFSSAFPIQGFQLLLAPTTLALPVYNHRLYVGTELANLVIAGGTRQKILGRTVETVAIGLGILPLRVGYWQPVLEEELSFEPFIEYSYYPTTMFQVGAKLNLYATSSLSVSFNMGYITCGGFDTSSDFFKDTFGSGIGEFSTIYAGISIGFLDRIFFEDELRYNRPELPRR